MQADHYDCKFICNYCDSDRAVICKLTESKKPLILSRLDFKRESLHEILIHKFHWLVASPAASTSSVDGS